MNLSFLGGAYEIGVRLKKNPAYNGAAVKVILKCECIDEAIFLKIKETFTYNTGCTLEITE